ncbi:MAG: (2Fe-2S)-binding protein [Candidatus Bathyarchaeia archaeon]|nr:(2Fe-2S)-binding protein [Candidatus Bathyarchaeota archaeon]
MRIYDHPILGGLREKRKVSIEVDGEIIEAYEGEPIAAALLAAGIRTFRHTLRENKPRGLFCAIGRCTDCVMTVDGIPNIRTCVTPVREGMRVETQVGLGKWRRI